MKVRRLLPILLGTLGLMALLAAPAVWVYAQVGSSFNLTWSTVDGGGGASTGSTFSVSGTIGQPDAGAQSGGTYGLQSGFWGPIASGPAATATATATPPPGAPTGTPTRMVTGTVTPVATGTATPPACVISFEGVHANDWFYQYVQYMFCSNVINGYHTSPPCSQPGTTCFKPNNTTTRGQLTKIVVRAFAISIDTHGGPHFRDVQPGSTFYDYVETGYNLGLWGGYADGNFKPGNTVNRGQITKMVVNAAILVDPSHWTLANPPTNTFQDVRVGSTFFRYIETAASHGVVNGYACGTSQGLPCVPPLNKAYFVPNANPTRAQISKITYLASIYGR